MVILVPLWEPAGSKMAPIIDEIATKCWTIKGRYDLGAFRWHLFANLHAKEHPKHPRDDFLRFCMDSASIFYDFRPHPGLLLKTLARFRHRLFASFSQDAKNRQEPAKNQAHNEFLKTWSSKLQFAECRHPPTNAFLERHLLKMGGGGVTPHGVFNNLSKQASY